MKEHSADKLRASLSKSKQYHLANHRDLKLALPLEQSHPIHYAASMSTRKKKKKVNEGIC
jgi:hypothetical protein